MSVTLLPRGAALAPLAALHAACFPDPWSVRAIEELLVTPGTFAFASEDGFLLARAAGGEAEILTLAVAPSARHQGTGRQLVEAAADHAVRLGAQNLFLEVGAANRAARALYDRLGFAEVGQRRGYYSQGREKPEDALVLRSKLPLSPLGKTAPTG